MRKISSPHKPLRDYLFAPFKRMLERSTQTSLTKSPEVHGVQESTQEKVHSKLSSNLGTEDTIPANEIQKLEQVQLIQEQIADLREQMFYSLHGIPESSIFNFDLQIAIIISHFQDRIEKLEQALDQLLQE